MTSDEDRARLDAVRDKYQSPSMDDLSKIDMLNDIQWLFRKIRRLEVVCAGWKDKCNKTQPDPKWRDDYGFYSK